jgi:hypothetical protein
MSRDPEHRSHIFRYIYSAKEKLIIHKKTLVLIGAISAALVGITQYQPDIQFIKQYSSFLQVIASFILAFFGYLNYMNAVKMSEKPAMVELCRFFISPLGEYLQNLKTREKEECYCWEFFLTGYFSLLQAELHARGSSALLPSPKILLAEFYSVLEGKMRKKKEWDEEVNELNRSCGEFKSKLRKLEKERLKELIERHKEEIRGRYETNEKMKGHRSPFQDFLKDLVDDFYKCHTRKKENQSIGDLSWYYLNDLFNRIRDELTRDLEEIDGVREKWEQHIDKLISLLEEAREYLRKEYKLTPSEQSLQITS